ncbi:MAG TPA: CBS domain-containing protein [Gemmatimonadales bacterium]|nr:CBS domain-containing protein [Gemmatimonadales bacterium]
MKVAELMQTELKTISVDATIGDAVDALTEAKVTAMPVMDRFGRAVGVIATRDILRAESTFNNDRARDVLFERTTVLEVMAPWPPTISPELNIKEAAQQMLYFDAQRLFVEHEGALVGVISQSDIVGAVARARA